MPDFKVGLSVSLEKSLVIPSCAAFKNFTPADIVGCEWIGSGNFKLLGAALGSRSGALNSCTVGRYRRFFGRQVIFFCCLLSPLWEPQMVSHCSTCTARNVDVPTCICCVLGCAMLHSYPTCHVEMYEPPRSCANLYLKMVGHTMNKPASEKTPQFVISHRALYCEVLHFSFKLPSKLLLIVMFRNLLHR